MAVTKAAAKTPIAGIQDAKFEALLTATTTPLS
jgi:hypothetical protein